MDGRACRRPAPGRSEPIMRTVPARRRVLAAFAALAVAGIAGAGAARAAVYCSEPVTPFCVNRTAIYEDDSAAQTCGEEIREFAEGMSEYIECLGRMAEEARARVDELRERHECMAAGRDGCR